MLPTQDCSRTYGGALRMLEMPLASLSAPLLSCGALLQAPFSAAPYLEGLHTLSAAGDMTLIDCKRILRGSVHRMGWIYGAPGVNCEADVKLKFSRPAAPGNRPAYYAFKSSPYAFPERAI